LIFIVPIFLENLGYAELPKFSGRGGVIFVLYSVKWLFLFKIWRRAIIYISEMGSSTGKGTPVSIMHTIISGMGTEAYTLDGC